jgi:signal transduction histidine kinase
VHRVLDILTSGVHDAKNQLFLAESLIVQAEAEHGIKLDEARFAIEQAASRLNRTLTAYKLRRHAEGSLSIDMICVADLLEEAAIMNLPHCRNLSVALTFECAVNSSWLLDQELVLDMLSNAIQNASRHAKKCIHASASIDHDFLLLRVEDDGPGFATQDVGQTTDFGIGLFVARELARQHENHGRHGSLHLYNGGRFGGAVFEVRLP